VAPEAAATHGLYERHAAKIQSYCQHQLGSREEAEDAVQTTFMNAFRALGRGVVPESEAAWLFKIAENVCLSRRRSSWRRGRIESPSDFEVLEEIVPGPNRQRDELIGIEDALASMPEQQRRAILLREWQGLSYREIAEELELSQSAVETLIFRARRSLAQGLEQPETLKKPKRKGLRRALHVVDVGTLFAAAKTLLAGSAAVKATAAAVAVTAAAGTAAGIGSHTEPRGPELAAASKSIVSARAPAPQAAAAPRFSVARAAPAVAAAPAAAPTRPASPPVPATRSTAIPAVALLFSASFHEGSSPAVAPAPAPPAEAAPVPSEPVAAPSPAAVPAPATVEPASAPAVQQTQPAQPEAVQPRLPATRTDEGTSTTTTTVGTPAPSRRETRSEAAARLTELLAAAAAKNRARGERRRPTYSLPALPLPTVSGSVGATAPAAESPAPASAAPAPTATTTPVVSPTTTTTTTTATAPTATTSTPTTTTTTAPSPTTTNTTSTTSTTGTVPLTDLQKTVLDVFLGGGAYSR
jgi:RNA polymerase sigma factor (sigma-70 family)